MCEPASNRVETRPQIVLSLGLQQTQSFVRRLLFEAPHSSQMLTCLTAMVSWKKLSSTSFAGHLTSGCFMQGRFVPDVARHFDRYFPVCSARNINVGKDLGPTNLLFRVFLCRYLTTRKFRPTTYISSSPCRKIVYEMWLQFPINNSTRFAPRA